MYPHECSQAPNIKVIISAPDIKKLFRLIKFRFIIISFLNCEIVPCKIIRNTCNLKCDKITDFASHIHVSEISLWLLWLQDVHFKNLDNWKECCQLQYLSNSDLIYWQTSCIIDNNNLLISEVQLGIVLISEFVDNELLDIYQRLLTIIFLKKRCLTNCIHHIPKIIQLKLIHICLR